MKVRIAVDLAKSVYQVAESVRVGQVSQRKRLNREVFRRYIQEQTEPVEWVMEACGTAHYWGRLAQSLGHRVILLHDRYVRPYRPQQSRRGIGEQDGQNLLGRVVSRTTLQRQLAKPPAHLAGWCEQHLHVVVVRARHCRNRRVLQRNKADNKDDRS